VQTIQKCFACQSFILIIAGVQHKVSVLNQALLLILRESTFDGIILHVFHSGIKILEHNFGPSITYIF
jgi:hypothetical protein